jgi:hypothetical protein
MSGTLVWAQFGLFSSPRPATASVRGRAPYGKAPVKSYQPRSII